MFLAAFRALPRYDHRGRLGAWLFAIARNQLRMSFRRVRLDIPLEAAEDTRDPETEIGREERDDDLRRLRELVEALPGPDRELIRLRFVAGLSFGEMAEALGRREDAVKKALYRLLDRLKAKWEARS